VYVCEGGCDNDQDVHFYDDLILPEIVRDLYLCLACFWVVSEACIQKDVQMTIQPKV